MEEGNKVVLIESGRRRKLISIAHAVSLEYAKGRLVGDQPMACHSHSLGGKDRVPQRYSEALDCSRSNSEGSPQILCVQARRRNRVVLVVVWAVVAVLDSYNVTEDTPKL